MADTPHQTFLNGQPLRSAMKTEDDNERPILPGSSSSGTKVVQIAEPEPEPEPAPETDSAACDGTQPKRQYSAGLAKRLSGRATIPSSSSRSSLVSVSGPDLVQSPEAVETDSPLATSSSTPAPTSEHHSEHGKRKQQYVSQKLLAQVSDWLENERQKKAARESQGHHHSLNRRKRHEKKAGDNRTTEDPIFRPRTDSLDSNSSDMSLDTLERILQDNMAAMGLNSIPRDGPQLPRRSSLSRSKKASSRALLSRASSDTDYVDGDAVVPSCDAVLDNSKTLSYNAGKSSENLVAQGKAEAKEREAWATFRNEIIRLAHTLRIKGWRRIPLDAGDSITVQRLSGALTNAVYVVTPPADVEKVPGKKGPQKVLLRIYGPQAEQLIDRENELSVLRRLARKKIGPRLLGTFTNGRFEQYLNSTTLTSANLREPETYKKIAKRMRELHEGIELLFHEREAGPNIFREWDQWVDSVEKRIMAIDQEVRERESGQRQTSTHFSGQGFVCGTEWLQFKATAEKYRAFLESKYRGPNDIKQRLVFAHNDTQYGNILRVRPDDEKSPLLQPANEHKQLVVIDFEYAAANLPGLEFANHFTEWAYNYHDEVNPQACRTERYPSIEDQRRFIKSYVEHRPQLPNTSNSSTPRMTPADQGTPVMSASGGPTSSSSIVDFMLDARVPQQQYNEAERQRDEQTERMVTELYEETKLWRPANSMKWVAWGIVQANLPELDALPDGDVAAEVASEGSSASHGEGAGDGEEDFDYLAYAQDRAMFFWGDCVQMGLVRASELPQDVKCRLKFVER